LDRHANGGWASNTADEEACGTETEELCSASDSEHLGEH
jgi:hypothetical protein